MTSHYDFTLDLAVENNSHTQLVKRIPRGSRVLELGCATGYMSAVLTEQLGCRVVGVEQDAAAAEQARARCARVIVADIEDPAWLGGLGEERFDVITCADVIEHLVRPEAALARVRGLLQPDGCLLASVPNGAHVALRLELLEGRFTYEDTGLLDRTHLHFYTYHSLQALFRRAGYRVDELSYTFHDIPDALIRERLLRMGLEPSEKTLALLHAPDAVAFQFIAQARPQQAAEQAAPIHELNDLPLRDSVDVYGNLQQLARDREQALQRQQEVILSKDAQLAELHQVASARQEIIDAREKLIEERDFRLRHLQELEQAVHELTQENASLRGQAEQLVAVRARLEDTLNSTGWRLWQVLIGPVQLWRNLQPTLQTWRRLHGLGGWRAVRNRYPRNSQPLTRAEDPDYQRWIDKLEQPAQPGVAEIHAWAESLPAPTEFSVLMPVYNTREDWLREALESVLAQSYPFWELCVVDDASTEPRVRQVLEEYRRRDGRVRVRYRETNGHISAATNEALAQARGAYVVLMDHDDRLAPNALFHLAHEVDRYPQAKLIYSDEDKINPHGERFAHYFKPDFNPDLMLSHNMVCHLAAYARHLVVELGGMRERYDGAQDWDLALRVIARSAAEEVRHIPQILYHWRATPESTAARAEAKPYALRAAIATVSDYLAERQVAAEVRESELIAGMLRVRYPLPQDPPLVSIIMPTRNGYDLISRCLGSLFAKTDYANYEVLVVDNDSDDPQTLEYLEALERDGRIRLLRYAKPFNFSAINNFAAEQATGSILGFLNNDLEVISPGWLEEMVGQVLRPEIGAVGARLWYPDERLQHGGVILGLGGVAGHAMKYLPRQDPGYNARAVLIQNYSAVTAACMLVRREVFEQVGGFDAENLPVAFNDVDFCLRVLKQGFRNLWTPYAEFYHHESASRGAEDTPEKQARFVWEVNYMRAHWKRFFDRDPAYNPNLTHKAENFALGD